MGGTGRPLGNPSFLQCQRRHPELLKIPTYLPILCWVDGPSPVLLESLVGCGSPQQSWLRALWVLFPALLGWGLLPAGGGVGGLWPILADGSVGAVPCLSYQGRVVGSGGVGGSISGGGLRGRCSQPFLAASCCLPWWGGWSLASPGCGSSWCSFPPLLAWACCQLWCGAWSLAPCGGGPCGCCSGPFLSWARCCLCWAG